EHDSTARRERAETVQHGHRERQTIDVAADAPYRAEQRRTLRRGKRRQNVVQHLVECVGEPCERELCFGRGRPATENLPTAGAPLVGGGRNERRLSDSGLAFEQEDASPLRMFSEESPVVPSSAPGPTSASGAGAIGTQRSVTRRGELDKDTRAIHVLRSEAAERPRRGTR